MSHATLEWMAAAHRRPLTLTKRGQTITITRCQQGGWRVRSVAGTTIVDAVRLEDQLEAWDMRGWREATA